MRTISSKPQHHFHLFLWVLSAFKELSQGVRQATCALRKHWGKSKTLRGWRLSSVVRHLPCKHNTIPSVPSTKRGRKGGGVIWMNEWWINKQTNKQGKLGHCGRLDIIIQQVPTCSRLWWKRQCLHAYETCFVCLCKVQNELSTRQVRGTVYLVQAKICQKNPVHSAKTSGD